MTSKTKKSTMTMALAMGLPPDAAHAKRRRAPKAAIDWTTMQEVPYHGAAHSNPYIDHCMVCLGNRWGFMVAPRTETA